MGEDREFTGDFSKGGLLSGPPGPELAVLPPGLTVCTSGEPKRILDLLANECAGEEGTDA